MHSTHKPLNETDLATYEATRDLAAELLQAVREMKAGQVRVAQSLAPEAQQAVAPKQGLK